MILQVQFLGVLNEFSYLLGQAFGGAILPPYSEAFGRKKLYIVATFLFCGFCIVVGAVPHIAAIVVGRFALGVLSAVAYVVAGSIEDMFNSGPRNLDGIYLDSICQSGIMCWSYHSRIHHRQSWLVCFLNRSCKDRFDNNCNYAGNGSSIWRL